MVEGRLNQIGSARSARIWIAGSAAAGALGGLIAPAPLLSCFLTAALVGLAQGWFLRQALGTWWTWFVTTALTGGAGMALFRAEALLAQPAYAQSGMSFTFDLLHNLVAGAIIGACQAFLLAGRFSGTSLWIGASAGAAALFWTATLFLPLHAQATGFLAMPAPRDRLSSAAMHLIAWGGLALVTAFVFPRLVERK